VVGGTETVTGLDAEIFMSFLLCLVSGIVCFCSQTLVDDFTIGNRNKLGLWTSDDNSMQSVEKRNNEMVLKALSPASYFYSLIEC
jgi:hypothetical protein